MKFSEVIGHLKKHLPEWAWDQTFVRPSDGKRLWESSQTNFETARELEEVGVEDAILMAAKTRDDEYLFTLDLDMEAVLLPSTQEGHYHLLVNKTLNKKDYDYVMRALAQVGIIQNGWANAAQNSSFGASLRLPWVKKGQDLPLSEEEKPAF